MNFLNDFFIASPAGAFIIIAAFIGILGAFAIQRYIAFRNATTEFRAAINDFDFSDFSGHALVNVLVRDYPILKSAVSEFRINLNFIQKRGFDKAWRNYHGGNEDAPDFLVLYGIPENGNEILKHNLESLLKFANQT